MVSKHNQARSSSRTNGIQRKAGQGAIYLRERCQIKSLTERPLHRRQAVLFRNPYLKKIMKKIILFLLITSSFIPAFSQDTLFVDISNRPTTKELANAYIISEAKNNEFSLRTYYIENQNLKLLAVYSDSLFKTKNGIYESYYLNGKEKFIGFYRNNLRDSIWSSFFENGQQAAKIKFQNGTVVEEEYWNMKGKELNATFSEVNSQPKFPGGQEKFLEYLKGNLKKQQSEDGQLISGKVNVGFKVLTNGKILNVHVNNSNYSKIDKEAIRVISEMPDWEHGKFLNIPEEFNMVIPIVF